MSVHRPLLFALVLTPFFAACPDLSDNKDSGGDDTRTCDDGLFNGDESDFDCGGSCEPCGVGHGCITEDDCADGNACDAGFCAAPSCDDGVKNGNETDVDCGGDCSGCDEGASCVVDEDCADQLCDGDTCQAPSCDDGIANGLESDVDCGGDCEPCERGQVCFDSTDCADSVCFGDVCERALIVDGSSSADAIVGVYVSQKIIRVDYVAEPDVTDYDGSDLSLPVSTGTFVSGGISDTLGSAEVSVAGIALPGATGHSYYQSIAPSYFGVILSFDSEASATNAYNVLDASGLDNRAVEIVILDTTP